MRIMIGTATLAAVIAGALPAYAADSVKVAVGQRGNWDTVVTELGVRGGIFKKYDIEPEIVYTSGGGETLQPVISGSVDIGVAVGTMGAMAAYAKGAPVRVIGAQATGSADYFYAKTESNIKSPKDADGKTIAFSTIGSSTHSMALALIKENKLTKAKPQATGNPTSTLTQVMTGQVDVGWASPPFGLKEIDDKKINIVARGPDIASVSGQTIRVLVANADSLAKKKAVLERFMQAYRETIDSMYDDTSPAIKNYAEFNKISEPLAKRVRDEFFPKSLIDPDQIKDLPSLMEEGVAMKYIPAALTGQQQAELFQVIPRKK